MMRDQLQIVLNMARYELDGKASDIDEDYPECKEAFDAVKAFCDNERSTWMVPAARGVDAVQALNWPWNRN